MIRDFIIWISEGLFWLQGGVMLVNTPWFLAWVLFWSLLIVSPMVYYTHKNPNPIALPVFLILFFPGLLMAIGPGIAQHELMSECRDTVSELNIIVDGELTEQTEINIRQCRYKENYYDEEYGEWQIVGQRQ